MGEAVESMIIKVQRREGMNYVSHGGGGNGGQRDDYGKKGGGCHVKMVIITDSVIIWGGRGQ